MSTDDDTSRGGSSRVLVRFPDDEVLEGEMGDLNLDEPDFELVVADPGTNDSRAMIPLPSVKCVTTGRRRLDQPTATTGMQKIAVRFRDGEVITGHIAGDIRRGRYGVSVELLTREGDAVEQLGIPYDSLKAVLYLSSWDSSDVYADFTGVAPGRRIDTPLVALLAQIRRLAHQRDRGEISDSDYRRLRQDVLDQI